MKTLSGKQTKMLACMIAAGLAVNFAGAAPANAKAKATTEGTNQSVEAEIADLTQRLNDLEAQLKAVKASEKATKEQVKKAGKSKNGLVKWSGSTKSGYWADSVGPSKIKSEFKLYGDADIGDGYHVNIGLKFKSTTSEAGMSDGKYKYGQEKNKVLLNAANVSKQFNDKFKVTVGTMKAEVGEGLWLAKGATNAFLGEYQMTPNDILRASYGYDSHDYLANDTNKLFSPPDKNRLLKFLEYKHDFAKNAYAGVYFGAQQPETYIGVYGAAPIKGKLWVSGEYIRNTNTNKPEEETFVAGSYTTVSKTGTGAKKTYVQASNGYGYEYRGAEAQTKGYMFNLNYGKAKKKGSWGATLQWLNCDQNLFMNETYSDLDDYMDVNGFKGVGLILDYALSDRSKISLLRYWGHTQSDSRNVNSDGDAYSPETRNSVYLKYTSKF